MKPRNIVNALNDIDFDMIDEAKMKKKTAQNKWLKWGAAAACFALILAAGALIYPKLNDSGVMIDGIERRYKEVTVTAGESAIEWPWEYKTMAEKYTHMVLDGVEYRTRAQQVSQDHLGDVLGICKADGYDTYTDKRYIEEFEVHAVKGIEGNNVVAVNMEGECIVFLRNDNPFPATLGEFIHTYSLADTLPLGRFSEMEGYTTKGNFLVNDDDYIWQVLSECADAPRIPDDNWNRGDQNYLAFTATSDALGVYKRAFYVSEDGYVWTNLMEYAYIFEIGTDAAEKIIAYAKDNSTETVSEPYHKSISGTVVEIGDGYVLIDDSVLCVDPEEGMVFTVPTDDLRIGRCVDSPHSSIAVGDLVVVEYTETIDVKNENIVLGAFSLNEGIMTDAGILIPE